MPNSPSRFGARPRVRRSGSTTLRDRSTSYARQRERILSDHPLCRYCLARGHVTAATVLDHILALALGGTNDPQNLAPACSTCNSEKGKVEQRLATRGFGAREARLDPGLREWLDLALQPEQARQQPLVLSDRLASTIDVAVDHDAL